VGTALAFGALLGDHRGLRHDPSLKTELELHFIAEGKNATRVELEHRRLDLYGPRRDEMRRIFDTEGDWGRFLEAFAQTARAASA
jgi:hypothetical protein